MASVTISPKYQVVIPKGVREKLKLKPGQKVAVLEKNGIVHVIPIKPLTELRGIAKGLSTKDLREEDERF